MNIFMIRGLDNGYTYPCSIRTVKAIFRDTNVSIAFGPTNQFELDSTIHRVNKKYPQKGIVVSSFLINSRLGTVPSHCILSLYKIRSELYSLGDKKRYSDHMLEDLYNYYTNEAKCANKRCLTYYIIEFLPETHRFEYYIFDAI